MDKPAEEPPRGPETPEPQRPAEGEQPTRSAQVGPPDEPAEVAAVATQLRRGDRFAWRQIFAAALVTAVLFAAITAVALLTRPTEDELRQSALRAATAYTESLTTYDAATLDEDIERVMRVATGEFREEYEQTIEQLRPRVEEQAVVAVGEVVGAGLSAVEGDRVSVLVAVNQTITTREGTRVEANRLRMTLLRQDGTWLVEQVERL